MGLFSKIKKAMGLGKQEVFRRWSDSELEEKKLYLESKYPEEFTAEDHYLTAEWVIQRYLPEGENPTHEQWSKTIDDIRQKIDINLKKIATGELVKTEYVQEEPYALTKEDFLKDVVPTFSRFGLLPDPYLKDRQGKELWMVLFEFTQPYSYKHSEARDALILFCDTYLSEKLVQDLGRIYTALRSAQLKDSTKVKVICSDKQCQECMTLDGKKLAVEELLASFKNGAPLFPHPLRNEDEVSWCPAPYLLPEIALREGDDPEFHEMLMKILEK
ncbi:hypothetical protein IG605_002705 [Pectobacterium quasiaquaticum]|uniref:hypothetical protein n=1 Tax=Pectobacterium TaxID=122277 RepID=UPI00187677AA|nr:hypothetical protein [Pectobacterium quasiaquaticum]MBE5214281.1 hypothetical protein [Pectobacterium quasiaquaticum]MBE5225292.1 hypothetical protein [Pectobacterium quasiaquaticum]URG53294.1 hypothetical protein IG605_002705 [Pectobacterium quasiaquaticum]